MGVTATEAAFGAAMRDLYLRAKSEAGYPANLFLRMVADHGPLEAARILLHKPEVSSGYAALSYRGRMDLTLEALVLQPQWRHLFTADELGVARARLAALGYVVDEGPPSMEEIAREVDRWAEGHPMGALQHLRQRLRGGESISARGIFSRQTIRLDYAFHHGGRTELQFNLGFEDGPHGRELRHGVAFSLEASQTLPDPVGSLLPRIHRLNEFFRVHPEEFADMRMWHYRGTERSDDRLPGPISPELIKPGTFIFLGARQSAHAPDFGRIVADLDRLLPLYEFVQSSSERFPTAPRALGVTGFRAGHWPRPSATTVTRAERVLDVQLRHNELQQALYERLVERFGEPNVGTEQSMGVGGLIDLVVRSEAGNTFYEIKTGLSARACIREALSQLLEYAFWPGSEGATALVIAGEPPLDPEADLYLGLLRDLFGIPVRYEQIHLP